MSNAVTWNLDWRKIEEQLTADGSKLPRVAIETGTCRGNGTRALAQRFERVITIELRETLHLEARARLTGAEFSHVEFVQGNSAVELPGILRRTSDSESLFFFLDAHWSGDQSVDWKSSKWHGYGFDTAHLGTVGITPSGPEQCPLIEELTAIVEHCRAPAIVLIDDLKSLPPDGSGLKNHEFNGEDWSHLSREKLLSIVRARLRRAVEFRNPLQWLLLLNARSI